jgi:hypothetical protein
MKAQILRDDPISFFCHQKLGWKRAREGSRSEAILDRLEELHQHSIKYKHLKPTVGCYKGAIQTWALSGRPDAVH